MRVEGASHNTPTSAGKRMADSAMNPFAAELVHAQSNFLIERSQVLAFKHRVVIKELGVIRAFDTCSV